uniref:Uncharacterized protein n=1 Tax=Rhizophora mucronata TaxID=61149 RepID=A0A2P2PVD0_RHIMU
MCSLRDLNSIQASVSNLGEASEGIDFFLVGKELQAFMIQQGWLTGFKFEFHHLMPYICCLPVSH